MEGRVWGGVAGCRREREAWAGEEGLVCGLCFGGQEESGKEDRCFLSILEQRRKAPKEA